MNIVSMGFTGEIPSELKENIARVIVEYKHLYRISDGVNDYTAELTGKFRFQAAHASDFPAVGDFVTFTKTDENKALITKVLPRFSCFSRQSAGLKTVEQVIAANIDYAFIVMALNADFNSRRLERYITLIYESGASPIIVLTKKDLCDDVEEKLQIVNQIALGIPVHVVNGITKDGIEELSQYTKSGKTITLVGSSGVGKSTLLNAFLGENAQKTQGIRSGDDKGKHTTTHRELFFLPTGAMVIDTPGMRELQMIGNAESISDSFKDIEEYAAHCKFSDCAHSTEPGCAVKEAISNGSLTQERFNNYLKLQKEIAYNNRRQNAQLQRAEKDKWKKISKSIRK